MINIITTFVPNHGTFNFAVNSKDLAESIFFERNNSNLTLILWFFFLMQNSWILYR